MELHPPQAKHVKAVKLYHKAFAAVTLPDVNETSLLLVTVEDLGTRGNSDDWRHWCSLDKNLGVHWSFYSRVLNIATHLTQTNVLQKHDQARAPTAQRIKNAAKLTEFLVDLVVNDYMEVITRKDYPSHSPMVKCLIAELLWPTMTGLEPWFRRPSTNLADLAALYVKASEAHTYHCKASEPDERSTDDEKVDNDYIQDMIEISGNVLVNMARMVAVTASWSVFCDHRDRQRGKRTSTRTLENELVSVLRSELDAKDIDVIEQALAHLPDRLSLKVNVALIQHNCSDALVKEDFKGEELSLHMITSRLMQTFPAVQQGEERDFMEYPMTRGTSVKSDSSESKTDRTSGSGTSNKMMKRNHKGETPLHIACINNRPEDVRLLLNQPGIQPNATDYAGWTPLGDACSKGHIECVRSLLSLPLKKFVVDGNKECTDNSERNPSAWEIDLTLCPPIGQTPLHDALGNGHLKIACMLLEKGGVKLLDIVDSRGHTPLDYCPRPVTQSAILEYACKLVFKSDNGTDSSDAIHDELMELCPVEEYEKVLPRKSVLSSPNWRERVVWWSNVVSMLITNFVRSSELVQVCRSINRQKDTNAVVASKDIISWDLEQYANDLTFCFKWKDCWDTFSNHLCRLLGGDEETISDVLSSCQSPIPLDLSPGYY